MEATMKETGIIRRIDDLGRIVIPKEVRLKAGISVNDPFEICYNENGVYFKKYRTEPNLQLMIANLYNAVCDAGLAQKKQKALIACIIEAERILRKDEPT